MINIDFVISFSFMSSMCKGNYYCKIGRNVIINKKIRWKSSFVLRSFKDEKKKYKKKGIRTRRLSRISTSTLIPFYITFAQRNTPAKLQPSSAFSKLHLDRVLPANDKLSLTTTEFCGISSSSIDERVVQKEERYFTNLSNEEIGFILRITRKKETF